MPVILDLHDATDAAQAVMHEFDARRKAFESVMIIIKRYSRNMNDLKNLDMSSFLFKIKMVENYIKVLHGLTKFVFS